ncbi:hypothetical protein GCM10023322_52630 [Rugosimonospora acidiphila]|uniref:Uncharacterized protein n=1 Tax=Rugosimonospora acidiphila TaxID=556531 RepID=A0ABP9S8Z5_9ACTN
MRPARIHFHAAIRSLTAKAKTVAVIGQTASNTPTGGVSAGTVCAEGQGGGACPNPVAPFARGMNGPASSTDEDNPLAVS